MKGKLMTHYCINKKCDFEETTHNMRDGMKCPKCNGPIMSVNPKKQKI
jgi:predicted Zn-ribbon and HTH transcriptional regulator